jgi:hypothetical protein
MMGETFTFIAPSVPWARPSVWVVYTKQTNHIDSANGWARRPARLVRGNLRLPTASTYRRYVAIPRG